MADIIGVGGIILSLVLLMYLAYRGITVLILAPLLAMLAALCSAGTHLMASYTEVFMTAFAGYAKAYFPLFLLGAVFGKVMEDSGAARSIAHYITLRFGKDRAILAIVLSCSILTYGGVSLFVVAFSVYPIAAALFREGGIPKRFIPAAIALGSFTFTMSALPGTPQIQNAIPMPFFETTAFAAPTLGLVGAAVMFGGGMLWLGYRSKKAMAGGEGYGDHVEEDIEVIEESELPGVFLAMIPIVIVIVLNFVLIRFYYSKVEAPYLEDFGTTLSKVKGIWAIIIALVVSIIVCVVLFWKRLLDLKQSVNKGAIGSLLAIANTSSEVGYGTVIAALGAFAVVKTAVLGIPGTPLISLATSTTILAGITGSGSGGLSISLAAFGDIYMQKALALGINPEAFHRISVMACGGLDTLPHNGAVITLLGICGLTHRQSYADLGMCTMVFPLIAVILAIILASMGVV